MNRHEFRAACEHLGLLQDGFGQRDAAQFLGRSKRTVNAWMNGEHRIPSEVGMLLSVLMRLKLSPAEVARMVEMPPEIRRRRG